MRSWHNHTSRY